MLKVKFLGKREKLGRVSRLVKDYSMEKVDEVLMSTKKKKKKCRKKKKKLGKKNRLDQCPTG